jgi:alpha-L-arabinofuranosidase
MRSRFVLLLVGLALSWPGFATAQTVRMTVHGDRGEVTINRHIYGHFSEHLGRMIYDGVWVRNAAGEYELRDDVIQALRALQLPNLRWPGGCFADYYFWRDGIGPRDQRPSMVNTVWGGAIEDNSFGTHEFMELVRRLDTEPIIVGNVGSGTVRDMADWWEYLNHPGGSSLADLRAANGHPEPFNVRFFGVGNENWGCGGEMTASEYAREYRRYQTFLRPQGNVRAFRIATGPNVDMYEWTETMMRDAGRFIDGLDLHYYTYTGTWQNKGRATEFTEDEWAEAMQRSWRIDELVRRHSEIMDRFDARKRVWLIVGEWGMWHTVEPGTNPGFLYQQNALRDAIVAGMHLNVFNNHADRVRMANLAQTVNVLQSVILTEPDGGRMLLTPTYHVFDMFKVHQDATLLPIDLQADAYARGDFSAPSVSASASRDGQGRVHITLTNHDPNRARTLQTELRGVSARNVSGRILTANTMTAHNTFDRPNAVTPAEFRGARLQGNTLTVELPAKSVVVLELR